MQARTRSNGSGRRLDGARQAGTFRRVTWRVAATAMAAVCWSLFAITLSAQVPPPSGSDGNSGLGVRQQRVERMFNDLEQRFVILATKLSETEPERAERLIQTLQQAKEMLVQQRMSEIATLINQTDLANATEEQARLLQDLRLQIRMLIDESLDDEKLRKEEIERLERWKTEIQNLIREEQPQERESSKLADRDRRLRRGRAPRGGDRRPGVERRGRRAIRDRRRELALIARDKTAASPRAADAAARTPRAPVPAAARADSRATYPRPSRRTSPRARTSAPA